MGLVRPNWKNGLKFLQYSMEHKVIIMISISYSFSRKTFCDLIFEKPINTTALVRGATWHGIIIACLLRPNYWVQTPNLHLHWGTLGLFLFYLFNLPVPQLYLIYNMEITRMPTSWGCLRAT